MSYWVFWVSLKILWHNGLIFLHFWRMFAALQSWTALTQSCCRVRGIWKSLGHAEQCVKPALLHMQLQGFHHCCYQGGPVKRLSIKERGLQKVLLRRKMLKWARSEKCGWEVHRHAGQRRAKMQPLPATPDPQPGAELGIQPSPAVPAVCWDTCGLKHCWNMSECTNCVQNKYFVNIKYWS